MTDEQNEVARLRKFIHDLRVTFNTRHFRPLVERLKWLEQRIERVTQEGKVPSYDLQEASALRHALAFMQAVAALPSERPEARPPTS